jgi:PAS domain S-box-containing protein
MGWIENVARYNTILSGVVVYVLQGTVADSILFFGSLHSCRVSIIRVVWFRDFNATVTKKNSDLWLNNFRIGVVATGLLWGVAGVFLFVPDNFSSQAFIGFVLVGVAAIGMVAYSVDEYCSLPFLVAVITPLILKSYVEGTDFSLNMSMMVLLFFILLLFTMGRTARKSRKNIESRLSVVQQAEHFPQSEARFRQMFEQPSSPMLLIPSSSGLIVDANRAAGNFYGYTLKHLKKMTVAELSEDDATLRAITTSGQVITKHRLNGGELRSVELHVSTLRVEDDDVRITRVLGCARMPCIARLSV